MSYYQNRGRSYGTRGFQQRRKVTKSFDPRFVIGRKLEEDTDVYEVINQFSDFNIDPKIAENISTHGYITPTPIQDQAIPKILEGRDVVGIANTGTGKTAAFLIPLLNKVINDRKSRVLIIAPTRELAIQIDTELRLFSRNLGIHSAVCIGGVSMYGQIDKLRKWPQFVIGTPGRLLDLSDRREINFSHFRTIVLDEVDRMLDMGFIHSIEKIISELPLNRQSLFFSATLDPKVKTVMAKFIHYPEMISIKKTEACVNIHQDVVELRGREKTKVLCELLDMKEVSKTLIFMRTKRNADKLHRSLSNVGFRAAVMHGNKSQNQRQRSLEQLKSGNVNILIATDVASRGIDIDDISHVINFDLPETYDDYIHRIGRTGRADKKGTALTFIEN